MVWTGALAAVVLLPVLSYWTPWRIAVFPSSLGAVSDVSARPDAQTSGISTALGASDAPMLQGAAHDHRADRARSLDADANVAAQSRSAEPASARDGRSATQDAAVESRVARPDSDVLDRIGAHEIRVAIAALWAIGTLILLARLLVGMFVVSRIVRRARPLDSRAWTVPLWEVADRLGLARTPRLLCSDSVSMPFACGLLRTPGRLQSAAMLLALAALTLSVSAMAPAGGARAASGAGSEKPAHDSVATRSATSSRSVLPAETTRAPVARDAAAAPDTGEHRHSRPVDRIVSSAVERSTERAVDDVAHQIASVTYRGLMSDWNDFAPRWGTRSLADVLSDTRASIRESFGEGLRERARSSPDDSATTSLLVKLLRNDSDARVRRTAAWALAQRDARGSQAVTAALASALVHDESADVREMAAMALAGRVRRAPSRPFP